MKTFFGYVRVSTAKQGEKGVSLQEQRDAIERYAQRNGLKFSQWFEERETAAKRGRPIFNKMLKLLKNGKVNGVIIHKIDRSARNLKDWADLGDIIDQGIEVHFVNEGLDLHSRGGRLSADIQAVVAADFIRNLKEETRKGFYGRLKQGLYPLPAPLGYLDTGKGKVKEQDAILAPLVRQSFELYATGKYNLDSLVEELYLRGLRTRTGSKVNRTSLSKILNNVFYTGIMRLCSTGEIFPGIHKPLIAKSLFDKVQAILSGKIKNSGWRHDYLFRRLLMCKECGSILIGEKQKGHIYYRCHTASCSTKCIREELVETQTLEILLTLRFNDKEKEFLSSHIPAITQQWMKEAETLSQTISLRLAQLKDRIARLTDALIDGAVDKEIYEERKNSFLMERKDLEERLVLIQEQDQTVPQRLSEFLELAESSYLRFKMGSTEEKRDLLKTIASNLFIDQKNLDMRLKIPFKDIRNRLHGCDSSPTRNTSRTMADILSMSIEYIKTQKAQENPDDLAA